MPPAEQDQPEEPQHPEEQPSGAPTAANPCSACLQLALSLRQQMEPAATLITAQRVTERARPLKAASDVLQLHSCFDTYVDSCMR